MPNPLRLWLRSLQSLWSEFMDWINQSAPRTLLATVLVLALSVGTALGYVELLGKTIDITVIDKQITRDRIPVRVTVKSTNAKGKTVTRHRIKYEYELRYWIITPTETLETNSSEWLGIFGIRASYETLQKNHRYSVRIVPWFGRRFLRDVKSDLGPIAAPTTTPTPINISPPK